MIIRAKTFKQWFKYNFTKGEMKDIAEYGAHGGFHHITYYNDTIKIYNKFEDDIWASLADDAEDMGMDIIAMISETFNQKSVMMIDSATQFKNLMVWYMCEKLARELTEF